ncbi:phage integrase N-terminal SAM-like domain-containing protein [Fusobacterium necrophorum subsp. funduliforme]
MAVLMDGKNSWEIDLMMLHSELLFREYAASTTEVYMRVTKDFLEFTDKDILYMSRQDIIRYLDFLLQDRGESENTILVKLNALEFFFEEVMNMEITKNITKYKRQEGGRVVTTDELSLLLASIPKRERILFKTILEIGKYPKEILEYEVKDLKSGEEGCFLKGHKIKKELAREIIDYTEQNEIEGYIFGIQEKKMHVTNVYLLLRKYTKEFLGEQLTFSDLRHTIALELWRKGKKEEMMEYIGNKSMASIKQWYKKRGILLED